MAQTQGNGNRNQSTQQGTSGQQGDGGQQSTQMARRTGGSGSESTAMARPMRRSRMMSPFSALRMMSPFMASSPFGMVRRMFDDMERMMDSMFSDYDERAPERVEMVLDFMPQIDVSRRGDAIVVHADLPGLSAEDLEVHATDEGLVIQGERRREDERTEGDVWRSERVYGRFSRLIPLPEDADLDSAQARFDNGVLEIQVKAPEGRGRRRQIEIQGRGQGQQQDHAQRQGSQSSSDQPQTGRAQGKS